MRRVTDDRRLPELVIRVTCEVSRRIYRQCRSNIRLDHRLEQVRDQLGELPRLGLGVRVKDLDSQLDLRLRPMRRTKRELIIGDFDQNGGILPRFGRMAGVPSIGPAEFMPRRGHRVLLVDLDGRVGVRKEFGSSRGRFAQELEALVHLGSRGCPVPELMNVDWARHSVTSAFVPGDVVRELLARAGADIRDRAAQGSYTRSEDKQRIRIGRELVPRVMSKEQIRDVAAGLDAIHRAGFVLEDVKFGNIILQRGSRRPIFVDLERALPIGSLPSALADHLKESDVRKLREHFGDSRANECNRA